MACAGLGAVIEVRHLGGMTNRNFRVATATGMVHVRLPGAGTEAYIDRAHEAHNARSAAALGINSQVVHAGPDGTMVCAFVDGDVVAPRALAGSGDRLEQAGRLLWRLHHEAAPFAGRFDPRVELHRHHAALRSLPDGVDVDGLLAQVDGLDLDAAPAPCHNDAWPLNLIYGPDRVVLVDWEYSGMNDPAWDLAHLSVECELAPADNDRLLHAYSGGEPPADLRRRVDLQRGVTDVLWGLWALVQQADGNDAIDFERYAVKRLRRAPTWWV